MASATAIRFRDLLSPVTAPVPDAVRPRLVALQAERLRAALPLLCVLTIANTVAMTLAVLGDLPWWQQALPPALIGGACIVLLLRGRIQQRLQPAVILRRSPFVAVPMAFVAGLWGVNAFTETEEWYCMVTPVFITLAAVIASSGLSAVPRASIGALAAAIAPMVVKMASQPYLGIRAMAAMLIVVAAMQAAVLLGKFRETVAMLVAEAALDKLAREDELTGLASRRAFMEALTARLDTGAPTTLVIADVDGLKPVNDRLGHIAGDTLLRAIGTRLRDAATRAEIVARLGGDEFALVFAVPTDADAAIVKARRTLAAPVPVGDKFLTPGASFGVATAAGGNPRDLLHRADLAMYRDKATRQALAA